MSLSIPLLGTDPVLARWLAAYEAIYQAAPPVTPLPAGEGIPEGASSFRLPVLLERREWLGTSGHFAHMPMMSAHVSRLGYAWGDDGIVVAAPSPGTFNALIGESGFTVAYAEEDTAEPPTGPWVRAYLDGIVVLPVGTESYYAQCLADGRDSQRAKALPFQLGGLAHGLTVHALNYHLIPRTSIVALAERVRAALGAALIDSWRERGKHASSAVATFYRSDLNRYAYAVWCRASAPEQFAALFTSEGNYLQLLAALDGRLAEVKAAQTGEPPPMTAPVEFDIP